MLEGFGIPKSYSNSFSFSTIGLADSIWRLSKAAQVNESNRSKASPAQKNPFEGGVFPVTNRVVIHLAAADSNLAIVCPSATKQNLLLGRTRAHRFLHNPASLLIPLIRVPGWPSSNIT